MSIDNIASFGDWVRRRRKSLDLTQIELADRVGCSPATLQKIERGERRPSRQLAELLAKHLEVPSGQQALFLKVARRERLVEALAPVPPIPIPGLDRSTRPTRPELPNSLTPLIGREPELAEITNLLQDPYCRLLTLTGPGGIGKTRLALEAAHRLQETFADGACFVALVGVSAAEFIVPVLSEALGFNFSGPSEPRMQLLGYLGDKQLLVVLDNMEHLLEGVELLSDILQHAPGVKLMVTSREALRTQAEWALEVQGLPLPESAEAGELEASSAAVLFLQRARQAQVNFTLTDADRPVVQDICRLVQGMPLGLELAAAWVRALSCREIAREIESGLDFLAVTGRDLPERHRSIRAVFDHSWKLLSADKQRVLTRLSVFRGGFTRQAAGQVAGANLHLLSSLVDKSLVWRSRTGRYDLHQLIQQYAAAHLRTDAQEEQETRRQHSHYYLTLLQARETMLTSSHQKDTFAELNADIDNIRVAWEAAVEDEQVGLLRMASWPLYNFYELNNYFMEGEALFRCGAEMARKRVSKLGPGSEIEEMATLEGALGDLLAHQAFFNMRLGRIGEAITLYRSSIDLLRPYDETFILGHAQLHYGLACWISGDYKEAWRSMQEGLPLSQSLQHSWLQACYSTGLGVVTHEQGDYLEAYRLLQEGLAAAYSMGDPHLMSFFGNLFTRTAQVLGLAMEAEVALGEGLPLGKEIGDRWGIGLRLERLAVAAQGAGNYAEASRLFDESVVKYREIGDHWGLSRALNLLGYFSLPIGNGALARDAFRQATQIALDAGVNPNVLDALAGLSILDAQEGNPERALELAIHVLEHPASTQDTKDRAGKVRAEIEIRLTPAQIDTAQMHGQEKTLGTLAREILAAG